MLQTCERLPPFLMLLPLLDGLLRDAALDADVETGTEAKADVDARKLLAARFNEVMANLLFKADSGNEAGRCKRCTERKR